MTNFSGKNLNAACGSPQGGGMDSRRNDGAVAEASAQYLAQAAGNATPVSHDCPLGYKRTEVGVIPEDWESISIGRDTVLKARIGWQALTTKEYQTTGDIYLVTGTDFDSGVVKWERCFYVSEWRYKQDQNIQLRNDDVLITKDGTIGKVGYVTALRRPATLNSGVFVIRPKNNNLMQRFLFYVLTSRIFDDFINKITAGSTITHLYQKDFVNFEFPAPCIEEQTAIANALSDVDALISELEKLIAKKQAIKTATMQQLLTGRTRLPQFALREDGTPTNSSGTALLNEKGDAGTGGPKGEGQDGLRNGYKQSELGEIPEDWQVVSFGDVLSIRHGKNQKLVESPNGNVPIYATGGQIGWASQHLWNKPSVLIGRKGTIDKPRYADTPFWTVDTLFYSEIKNCVEPKFIFYKFCMIDWMQYNEASGVPSLNASTIESVDISLPSKEEQKAIATILSDMDEEIQALQQRLAKTRQIKQGMMQELLTGKTRLVKPEQAA